MPNIDKLENTDKAIKRTSFFLIYERGEHYLFKMDRDSESRISIEKSIETFLTTGKHCFEDTPTCFLRWKNTFSDGSYISTAKSISFDGLIAVIIHDEDIERPSNGGSCDLPNGAKGLDGVGTINFSMPISGMSTSGYPLLMSEIIGPWSDSRHDDLSSLHYEWRKFKQTPDVKPKLKWTISSQCFDIKTTLYLVDFSFIHSISIEHHFDSPLKEIEYTPNSVPFISD